MILAINVPHIIGMVFFFRPAMIASALILNLLLLWLYLWERKVEREVEEKIMRASMEDLEER